MARSDTPRQLSLSAVKAVVGPSGIVHRSTADEGCSNRDPVIAHEKIRRGAMAGGLSG